MAIMAWALTPSDFFLGPIGQGKTHLPLFGEGTHRKTLIFVGTL